MKHSLLLPACGALLFIACDEWPRSSNLPDEPGVPAPDDPGDLVEVEWVALTETVDAPIPNTAVQALSPGDGVVIDGTLTGIGWNDDLPNREWSSPVCDGENRRLTLGIDGDWTGDVDAIGVEVVESSQLCARVTGLGEETGWDLVLIAVDECVLPEQLVFQGEAPIGLGSGGDDNGWSVFVQPGFYQLSIAAYDPVEPDLVLPYQLALAALPSTGDASGVCPSLPEASP